MLTDTFTIQIRFGNSDLKKDDIIKNLAGAIKKNEFFNKYHILLVKHGKAFDKKQVNHLVKKYKIESNKFVVNEDGSQSHSIKTGISIIWMYLEILLHYYYCFVNTQEADKIGAPEITNKEDGSGSLLMTCVLAMKDCKDLLGACKFVAEFVLWLSKQLEKDLGEKAAITATPAISNDISKVSERTSKGLLTYVIICILSLLLSIFALINSMGGDKDDDWTQKSEQFIKNEVQKEVQDAINQEKLDWLVHQFMIDKTTLKNDTTKTPQ